MSLYTTRPMLAMGVFSITSGNLDQREPLENDEVDVIDTVMADM